MFSLTARLDRIQETLDEELVDIKNFIFTLANEVRALAAKIDAQGHRGSPLKIPDPIANQ